MDINNNFFDEFEEQSQLELRDLNFLNLDEINYLQLKDDMYKDVSFNKKISFSEIMYESKYNATDKCKACEDKFYSGDINIKLLAEDIKKNNSNTSFFFFYQKYTKNLPIVDLFPVEDVSQQLNTKSSNNFLSKSSLKFPTSIPFEYVEENTKKKKTGQLQVFLNQRACNVNISKYGFSFAKDLVNNKIKYRLEFIYSDSIDKRQFVTKGNENSYVVEDKYVAISIETESCDDFIALVQYLNLTYLFYTAVSVFLSNQLQESKTVDELVFIYNQLPLNTNYLKQINIKSDVLKNHVDILLKHDTTGFLKFYNDESGTLIKIFSLIILNPLYIEILFDNVYIKNIYSNLSGKSTWNDTQFSNKILFAKLLSAMALSNKLGDNKPIGKTFYYGNDYKIDSDISWFSSENEDEFYLQQYKEESYQVEVSTETDDLGVSTNAPGQTETRTIKKKLDNGAMYKPLDLVTLIYYKGQEKQILLVPAIYIKAIAEEDEWIEVDKNIRIGLDILAVIGGLVVLGTTGNPLFLAAAYADIAIAGTDVIVQLSTKELEKTPQGRDFLQTWEKIYLAGGIATAIISAPQLLQSFYSVGNKILKTAKGVVLVEVRQFYLKAFLEINISNFNANTVKVLSNNTEIVLATNGLLNLEKEIKLFQNGILTVAGQVQKGEKIEEQIALVYKGEVIIEGNKNTFREAARKLVNSTHNEKKLLELCEEILNRRRIVSLEDDLLFGKLPIKGVKMTFNLRDELGNFVGQLTRSPNGNELYYKLIQKGKEIDIKCYMKLLDDKYKLNGLPIKDGEHLLYGDFNIPKNITEKLSGLGQIMYEDGLKYFLNSKKYGKVDGTVSVWTKAEIYNDYGGQSINLEQFWKAVEIDKMSYEKAAFETFAGKQAKKFGFTKVRLNMDETIITNEKVQINFLN